MKRLLTIFMFAVMLALPAAADHHVEPEEYAMTLEARQAGQDLIKQLGGALKQALAESGPDGAISVCRDIAPALAASLSRETGWKVSRVSLKTRNPLTGQPDAWEQKVLHEFDEAAAAARNTTRLEHTEIVTEPDGRYFRYMRALPVKPLCLTCHGTDNTIPASVQARLQQDYPNDRATGYYAGQIRGAVTIKRRLELGN